MNEWVLFIDIEGFSDIYKTNQNTAMKLLAGLAGDLYKIGTIKYPNVPHRLFIYQSGDGFFVRSDSAEGLNRPLAIAIALMRSMVLRNGLARVAISGGEIGDTSSCYLQEIGNKYVDGGLALGKGLMFIYPVMGTALINSYTLSKAKPKGPLLLIDKFFDIPESATGIILKKFNDFTCVNWIYTSLKLADEILQEIGINPPPSNRLCEQIEQYLKRPNLDESPEEEWKKNTRTLMNKNKHSI